jgi:diguanylate cyclase (GGDEF)-like protein
MPTEATQKQTKARKPAVRKVASSTKEESYNDLRMALLNHLQSTLELDNMLETFFKHVSEVLNCNGMSYGNSVKNIELEFGRPAKHSASYSVTSENESLGELKFMRSRPFAEAELAFIEALVGIIFYPLRNALKYKEALARSYVDPLTGLLNRLSLDTIAPRELKLSQRHNKALSLLVIDLDRFKEINDQYGHLAGDQALKSIADVIKDSLRETDQVFRFGGEEFVVLLNESDARCAQITAERIRKNIAETCIERENETIRLTTSVGISAITKSDDFESLFARADEAVYLAKQEGRNRVIVASASKQNEIQKIA